MLLIAAALVVIGALRYSPSCSALVPRKVTADTATTGAFAAYGDGATAGPQWAGGDGTHSVRLPDGRTLWLFDDTLLGPVRPPDIAHPGTWSPPGSPGVANSAVIQSAPRDGARLVRTIIGGPDPVRSWIPGEHDDGAWNWPVAGLVDTADGRPVLRVLAHHTTNGRQQYVFGIGQYTLVRTYALPSLRLLGEVTLPIPRAGPAQRVLYGTTTLADARYFYVYGNNAPPDGRAALYLARVPRGAVDRPEAWRYWDHGRWRTSPARARPLPAAHDDVAPVSTGFGVVRRGHTYVLFSMRTDPRVSGGIVGEITASWGCTPAGPWHGAYHVYTPPEAVGGGRTHTMIAYNPQAHPALTTGAGVSLSYDLNDAAGMNGLANVKNDLSLYRPRFLHVRLGPPTSRAPGRGGGRGSAHR